MRKFLMLVCVFSISAFPAYAEVCQDLFSMGAKRFNEGNAHHLEGKNHYEQAVRTYNTGDRVEGCETLFESYDHFLMAKLSFAGCQSDFKWAMNTCSGTNTGHATQNHKICTQNLEVSEKNLALVMATYTQNCIAPEDDSDEDEE